MPDDPYSLADLARLADVTPRTVRYYIAQGLLPSPGAAGPATRYGEGHLLRLRLIRHLQREHLPLAEIRARLEQMGDDEVRAALDAEGPAPAAPPMDTAQTLAHVRALMAKAGVAPRFYDQPRAALEPAPAVTAAQPEVLALRVAPPPDPSAPPPALTPAPAAAPAPRGTAGDRSTWERLALTPDVELHVRRPLDRTANKRVERLVRIARELFDDDG
jgi:DNA-binding transcriptional MerR regulator